MSNLTAGLLALAIMVVAVYLGFSKAIPFRNHFEIKGVFQSSNNIKPGSPVRIAGVAVGKVVEVDHARDGSESAVVTMRMNENGLPVHKDAKLKIRPRIFLEGNFFVDMQPGSPSAPKLGDGDIIPINQTATPVQLDQVLTALQSDTREDLKLLLKELGTALEKGAPGFNRSTQYWTEAYRDGALVSDAMLGRAEHDLSGYIEHMGTVAEALDRSPEALKSLITDLNATFRGFAAENANLRAAIAELPRTLRAGQPALGELNEALPSLRALARDLRPGVRSSLPAVRASVPLVRELRGLVGENELRGLVRDLRGATPSLTSLTTASVPLYKEVRRASSCQNDVILPWTRDKIDDPNHPAPGPVFKESVKPFIGLAGESRSGDSNGQWFRVLAAGGNNLIETGPGQFATSDAPIEGTNPPPPKTRPPLRPDVPCETQQPPDLRTRIAPPPPQWRADTSSAAYKERYAKAKATTIDWAKDVLEENGLRDSLKVVTDEIDRADIAAQLQRTKTDRAARAAAIQQRFGR